MVEKECIVQRYTVDDKYFIYLNVDGKLVVVFEAQTVTVRAENNCAVIMCDTGVICADKVRFDINSDAEMPIGVENNDD